MQNLNNLVIVLSFIALCSCEGARDNSSNYAPEIEGQQITIKDFEEDDLLEPEDVMMDDGDAIDFAEVDPQFPGGESAMNDYISRNVVYPQEAIEMGEQGIVYVEFVVNKDGSIQNTKAIRGVSPSLDKEAVRVIRGMPKWKPGIQNGEKVRVRYTIPIHFRLD